mmetsp:Transcript_58782/g.167115  ORF Transcript_58782/g.167115 Transcript_58782/m.167115 type:complete len:224 (-) Transcript_58782:28-699(-)
MRGSCISRTVASDQTTLAMFWPLQEAARSRVSSAIMRSSRPSRKATLAKAQAHMARSCGTNSLSLRSASAEMRLSSSCAAWSLVLEVATAQATEERSWGTEPTETRLAAMSKSSGSILLSLTLDTAQATSERRRMGQMKAVPFSTISSIRRIHRGSPLTASNETSWFLRIFATLWIAVARLSASRGKFSIATRSSSSIVFSGATMRRWTSTLRLVRPFFRSGG